MNNSYETRISLTKIARNTSNMNVSLHMHVRLQQPLEMFFRELGIYARVLKIDFADDVQQALDLILREGRFIDEPTPREAQELTAAWKTWTDQVLFRLQRNSLDGHYPVFKRRLGKFVDALSVSRAKFLPQPRV